MPPKAIPYLSFIVTIIVTIVFVCLLGRSFSSESDKNIWDSPKNSLKVWVLSDIQPIRRKQREEFERAIEDINRNVPGIDFAIVVGDILQWASNEGYDWYIRMRSMSYIKEWYEIIWETMI